MHFARSCLPLLLLCAGCTPSTSTTPAHDGRVGAAAASSSPSPLPSPSASAQAATPASQEPAGSGSAGPKLAPPTPETLETGSNAFAIDLYAHLRPQQGNLAVSPASITLALAMTWAGAKGETAAQMEKVLHFPSKRQDTIDAAGRLLSTWNDPSRSAYTLRVANRLFGEKTYRFEPDFLKTTDKTFGAPIEALDFKGAPDAGRQQINGWVAKKTNDRIKDLIPKGQVDRDTRLVLVNAIYFLGDWITPFTKANTRPAPFFASATASKDVPTMHQRASFRYAAVDGLKVLEMPYAGNELAMAFVLPDAKDGLDALEQRLTDKKLSAWLDAAKPERVDVSLPSFEINPGAPLSLGDTLKSMGMKLPFDPAGADFTGIANPPNPKERLFIGAVFHKAFVKVDEKGTEAAAATAVGMIRSIARVEPDPAEFHADHPFLFFLRDVRSGMIVFMGRVADPGKA